MALQEEFKKQGEFLFRNRSFLPLILLATGVMVFVYTEYHEIETPETWFSEHFEFFCLAVSLFGLFIRVVTVGHTPKGTSGRNTRAGQVAEQLNTTGVYSVVRHPLYLGNFFMWLGVSMLTENVWFNLAFVIVFALYYERIMYAEETFLQARFGEEFSVWANRVQAFVPSFEHYIDPVCPFSYKKVLRQEKNGLCAVFLIFWMYDALCDLLQEDPYEFTIGFWFYSACGSLLLYTVLKMMKKRHLLSEDVR